MKLLINRKKYDDCTVSRVRFGTFQCWFLELPDLDNAPNVSCIPDGNYTAQKRISPSKGYEVMEYLDVPGRTYIQIHPGNYTRQILGCQLPGDGVKDIDGDTIPDVTNSEAVFEKLMSLLPHRVEVEITS